MAKVTIYVYDCMTKVSPDCTKTFQREPKRGRPPVSCPACRTVAKKAPTKAAKPAESIVAPSLDRTCPCGTVYQIKPGRGRKAEKCEQCREAGTVYRADEDGQLQAIRAETLAEEQRELKEQAGKDRAALLCQMMEPLLKANKERKIIVH